MRSIAIAFLIAFNSVLAVAQNNEAIINEQPKLVVGIVVDQMRSDYIYRFWDKYSENGFRKLCTQGFNCLNTQYIYMPTYTGPGHASIYTGTTPATHGIIGNNWFERKSGTVIYCTGDSTVSSVGGDERNGRMSPLRLIGTTIGDELRLFSNFRSKVISVSLKDRAAILPGGHTGQAYWFDNISNNFITSSYYASDKKLPSWLIAFNEKHLPDQYLNMIWKPLLDITEYKESTADNTTYESVLQIADTSKPVFNYDLKEIRKTDVDLIRKTPYGNTLTKDLAIAAINGENLGSDSICDMLMVSFSSTDYVGHNFGTNAIETEDTYLRIDRDIAELITFLDKKVGKNNYVLFLTADHAALPNPVFLRDNKIPAGHFFPAELMSLIKKHLGNIYNDTSIFSWYINDQVWLNDKAIKAKGLDRKIVTDELAQYILELDHVSDVITSGELSTNEYRRGMRSMVQMGYNFKRSGDIAIIFEPGYIESYGGNRPSAGTTHGSPYRYDTQVPLLWYGWKIKGGETMREIHITDIAATVTSLLKICQPSGCIGEPIIELIK
jgi:predicted AlkP superfamily pyrophosphatase or phosphodiesterase